MNHTNENILGHHLLQAAVPPVNPWFGRLYPSVFVAKLRGVIQAGTTLVVSDIPVDRRTLIESEVNILTTDLPR